MLKTPIKISAGLFASVSMMSGLALAGNPAPPAYTPDLLPPNPETGECYARVEIPAQYRTEGETVMLEDGYTALDISEPQLRSRQEQVLIKEESVRYQVRQPTYRTVTEQIMVRPAYEKLHVSPPQFSTVPETLTVTKPRLIWKRGNPDKLRAQGYKILSTADGGVGGRGYRSTTAYGQARTEAKLCGAACEVWCLVEAPAETVTYKRKVVTNPSRVQRVPVPAKYTSITKQVVADPGGVREIPVPAEYRSVIIEELTNGGGVRETERPPVYGDIAKKVMVMDGRYEWRRVVCKPGTHPADRRGAATGGTYSSGVQSGTVMGGGYSSRGHTGAVQSSAHTYQGVQSSHGGASHRGSMSGHSSSGMILNGGHASSGGHVSSSQTSGYVQTPSAVTVGGQTHYYGSDLPTYSEDYRLPAPSAQPLRPYVKPHQPAREKPRYR